MGLQLKHLSCWEVEVVISMKFFALICLLPLAFAEPEADPGYGHGRYGSYSHRRSYAPKCRTVYDTITESACTTETSQECVTVSVPETRTETREERTTTTEQECVTVSVEVPEQQCATTTEQECTNFVRQVPETVCNTVTDQVCVEEAQCTTEQQCTETTRVIEEQQCTTQQQCTETQQCTTETQVIPETTYTEECQDIVSQVCQEVQTQVRVAQQVIAHPSVVGAPAIAAAPGVAAAPAAAVGPLVGALGLNPAVIQARGKRDADAEADPQLLLNAGLGLAGVAPAVAGVAPVAVAPRCQQKVDRQCRTVPVQSSRTVAVPK